MIVFDGDPSATTASEKDTLSRSPTHAVFVEDIILHPHVAPVTPDQQARRVGLIRHSVAFNDPVLPTSKLRAGMTGRTVYGSGRAIVLNTDSNVVVDNIVPQYVAIPVHIKPVLLIAQRGSGGTACKVTLMIDDVFLEQIMMPTNTENPARLPTVNPIIPNNRIMKGVKFDTLPSPRDFKPFHRDIPHRHVFPTGVGNQDSV